MSEFLGYNENRGESQHNAQICGSKGAAQNGEELQLEESRFRNFVRSIKEIPTLPAVAIKVTEVCQDESSTVEELEEVIASDPSIAARILRIANSAFFGCAKKVDSISRAIILLGFDTVKSLALSTSVFDLFSGSAEARLDWHQFWLHSVACGRGAQLIAEDAHARPYQSSAFLAGLLHDIGKLVLDNWFHEPYRQALLLAAERPCTLAEAEKQTLGFDHSTAGAWFAKSWGLPDTLARPMGQHHSMKIVDRSQEFLVAAVHVGDVICWELELGSGWQAAVPELNPVALEILDMSPEQLQVVAQRLAEQEGEMRAFLTLL